MLKPEWKPVGDQDEYSDPGDTVTYAANGWMYYWNEQRKVVRRYGIGEKTMHVYQEARCYSQPDGYHTHLATQLSSLFRDRIRRGSLLVDEQPILH